MNAENARRARQIAGQVENRARRMVNQMEAIQATNLAEISVSTVKSTFTNLVNHWREIEDVLSGGLSTFEEE